MARSLDDEDHRTLQNKCKTLSVRPPCPSLVAIRFALPTGPVPTVLPASQESFHLPKKKKNFKIPESMQKENAGKKKSAFRSVHRKFPSLIELVAQSLSPCGGERLGDEAKERFPKRSSQPKFPIFFL